MTTTELYGQIGGDYADVLKRFNSDAMVKRFAIKFLKDESFEKLCIAMAERNTDTAFRAAHTLKGICLNLGFGDLYRVSSAITEALRKKNFLKESATATIRSFEGEVLGVQLPDKVTLQITEAEAAVKGDTATGATKNAVLETGFQIKVPLFIDEGEMVVISTAEGKYSGRA